MKTLESKLILKSYYYNTICFKRDFIIINNSINRKCRKKKLIKSLRKIIIKNTKQLDNRGQNLDKLYMYGNYHRRKITMISNF